MTDKFEFIQPPNTQVADKQLIVDDLKCVAEKFDDRKVSQKRYTEFGKYDCSTVIRKFNSWNEALQIAGLPLSNENNISDERLYENILNLWQHLGRQPRRKDLINQISEFSQSPYNRRFGGWTQALQSFVDYANSEEKEVPLSGIGDNPGNIRKTPREPTIKLKRIIEKMYNYKCNYCGASPAKDDGITKFHIDHIHPWNKGGETVLENLQLLCESCNLKKGDRVDE